MNEITIKATGDADVVSASNGSMNVTIPIRIIRRGRRKAVTRMCKRRVKPAGYWQK